MSEEMRSGLLLGVEPLPGYAVSRSARPKMDDDDTGGENDDFNNQDDNQPEKIEL
jgi:hypothetical protein